MPFNFLDLVTRTITLLTIINPSFLKYLFIIQIFLQYSNKTEQQQWIKSQLVEYTSNISANQNTAVIYCFQFITLKGNNMATFNYRLGFDLGYTSIGWACIILDNDDQPCGIHDFGVRIFPSGRDDKSKAPTSVERREKRGARRNRDRYVKRRKTLLDYMIAVGLQPKTQSERQQLAEREPLELRAKGVTEELSLHKLGRALFHLNQRRGFKSNRIAERSGSEDESGLKKGISVLAKQLKDNQQTLGQFLFERLQNGQSTRLKAEENAEDRWTSRQMVEDEFWVLLNQQKKYHGDILTDNVVNHLHDIIWGCPR